MLIKLIILLFVLMLLVGEERGFASFLTLVINCVIMILFIYLVRVGGNPYLLSFATSILITWITLVYQNGKNVKTLASVISVILVMAILTLGIMWMVTNSHIGGYNEIDLISEEAMYLATDIGISMNAIIVCVVLIGLLGAVMDTSIAITTAVYEVHRNNNSLGLKELMQSGKNVGKDILGTTSNTLLFAGMGEILLLFIWLSKMNHYSIPQLINSKAVFQELIIILVSNIGCLLIIPISVLVISYLLKQSKIKWMQ